MESVLSPRNHLYFSDHVDKPVSDCDKRLYSLRQVKVLGLNQQGLTRFFCSNVRSLSSYAAPAWFPLLSDTDKIRLEKIQIWNYGETLYPAVAISESLPYGSQ